MIFPGIGDNYMEINTKKSYRVTDIEYLLDATLILLYGWSNKVEERVYKKVLIEDLDKNYKRI